MLFHQFSWHLLKASPGASVRLPMIKVPIGIERNDGSWHRNSVRICIYQAAGISNFQSQGMHTCRQFISKPSAIKSCDAIMRRRSIEYGVLWRRPFYDDWAGLIHGAEIRFPPDFKSNAFIYYYIITIDPLCYPDRVSFAATIHRVLDSAKTRIV